MSMFWYLVLAHFIADYPLQTTRIVYTKHKLPGLVAHVSIHFLVLLIIAGALLPVLWPYLLILALLHFGIDRTKALFSQIKPHWIVGPYLADQALHIASIALVSYQIGQIDGLDPSLLPFEETWAVYAIGYLLVTYVWFISERLMVYREPLYQQEVHCQFIPRMMTRAVFLTLLLTAFEDVPLVVLGGMVVPYAPSSTYRWRALLTDISAALVIWLFIRLAT